MGQLSSNPFEAFKLGQHFQCFAFGVLKLVSVSGFSPQSAVQARCPPKAIFKVRVVLAKSMVRLCQSLFLPTIHFRCLQTCPLISFWMRRAAAWMRVQLRNYTLYTRTSSNVISSPSSNCPRSKLTSIESQRIIHLWKRTSLHVRERLHAVRIHTRRSFIGKFQPKIFIEIMVFLSIQNMVVR